MRLAINIGLNFQGSSNPLPGSVNACNAWYSLCRRNGFDCQVPTEQYANRNNLATLIDQAYARLTSRDLLVITWAGHGVRINYQGNEIPCLVPWDCLLPSENWNLAIPYYQWAQKMAKCPCRLFTVMDVCYGAMFRTDASMSKVVQGITGVRRAGNLVPWEADRHVTAQSNIDRLTAAPPEYLSFFPCTAAEESVQMKFGGKFYSMFSYHLTKLADTQKTYYQNFSAAKIKAEQSWSLAHPRIAGPDAFKRKKFLS